MHKYMKLNKKRLQEIIKEELETFKKNRIDEVSSFVTQSLDILRKNIDSNVLLDELFKQMNDSEAMDKLNAIAQKYNVNLKENIVNSLLEEVIREEEEYNKNV